MKDSSAALAVFVKTPGLSPIKTRLAAGLGCEQAEEFYRLSLDAVEATVASAAESHHICAYWAIAEEAGLADPRWQRFSRIHQGTGGLGERLSNVFSELKCWHDAVVAIGADSPQITPQLILDAVESITTDPARPSHVMGRCHDGGFYLFGANYVIPNAVWEAVPFGTTVAAETLCRSLSVEHATRELPVRADVDRAEDLTILCQELLEVAIPTTAQRAVLDWATRISVSVARAATGGQCA